MKFQKGNQLWKLAQSGRPPKYDNPDQLWEDVCRYFQWADDNPILKTDFKGKEVETVQYDLQRPYTWRGLYAFLRVKDLEHYKTKSEFSEILAHIDNIIFSNKFDGAAVGIFNHSIIARDLGLVDKQDHTTKGEKILTPVTAGTMTREEMLQYLDGMNDQET